MNRRAIPVIALLSAAAGLVTAYALPPSAVVRASDHDDGENDVKSRALNITDLYVFREDWQSNVAGTNSSLILVMNSNPRSVARQQYYFSDDARYEFNISRVGQDPSVENDTPLADAILRFEFDAPLASNVQGFTMTAIVDSQTFSASTAAGSGTTTLASGAAGNNFVNVLTLNGTPIRVFAGLREDPFFFDVEQFFRIRGGAPGATGFRAAADAVDFAAGYNVNSIVVGIPIAFLAGASGADVFDVWTTISLPNGVGSAN
jgi:hypothetical protein